MVFDPVTHSGLQPKTRLAGFDKITRARESEKAFPGFSTLPDGFRRKRFRFIEPHRESIFVVVAT